MKLRELLKMLSRSRIALTAAFLAVCVLLIAVIPTLLTRNGDRDERPAGVLRGPQTQTVTLSPIPDDMGDPITAAPFAPVTGDYSIELPENTPGALYAWPTECAVLLKTADAADTAAVMDALTVTPQTPVIMEASGEGVLITPMSGAWEENTLYRLSLSDAHGALAVFQTARPFAVDSVYPAHASVDVPTDTGIEITFTDTVRAADLTAYLTVNPPIDGRIELYPNGRTAVIIPDEPLEAETQYTVTVKTGLPSDNGTTLSEERVFGFFTERRTSVEMQSSVSFSTENQVLTSPGTAAVLNYNLYCSGGRNITVSSFDVTASVYAYSSADALREALFHAMSERGAHIYDPDSLLPTDGLKTVWEGTPEKVISDSWRNSEHGWLYLPVLDEGIYLVELHGTANTYGSTLYDTVTVQTIVQVTPLRTYTEHVGTDEGGESLIWVHSTESGTAVKGAAVAAFLFENTLWNADGEAPAPASAKAVTDTDGLAYLTAEAGADTALLHITHDGHSLILGTSLARKTEGETYRMHLYTDRAVYFPNDTVYFHGVLGRTYPTQNLPDTLSLSVAGCDTGTRVSVLPDGSFSGSFPVEDWLSRSISFTLTDGDGYINLYRSLRVTQQEKPVYTLTVDYDRPCYTLDHRRATVTMTLSYFDGSPAPGMQLSVHTDGKSDVVRTDEDGRATFTYDMPNGTYNTTEPVYSEVSVQLSGYETTSIYQYRHTEYFHSSGVMTAERLNKDQSRVTLHHLDTSRILTTDDIFRYPDGYPTLVWGKPMDTTVRVALEKRYYVKTKSGSTYYDPINKVTVEQYDYQPKTDIIKTYEAKVTDGELLLDHIDASGEECSYYYVVSWDDPVSGRTYTEHVRANRGSYDYAPYGDNTPQYALTANLDSALPGEEIVLSLTYGDEPAALTGTHVLYTRHNAVNGRADVTAGAQNSYRYTFDESCTVGCAVYVTVFDGEKYLSHLSHTAVYDEVRGSTAEMTVTADSDTYKPGEQAVITVTSPALAGGTVLVSVVDEACFALGEHSPTTDDYFRFAGQNRWWGSTKYLLPPVSRGSSISLLSLLRGSLAQRYLYDDMVEMEEAPAEESASADSALKNEVTAPATGGAHPDGTAAYVREKFRNNAAFVAVILDENGIGTASVTVPDNITTWRLTAIGFSGTGTDRDPDRFTSGVKCGTVVSNTVCTQPFFLNVTMPDLFLSADEISLSARTAGTVRASAPDTPVTYRAVLYDETGAALAETASSAAANETAWFSFAPLAPGAYSVVVSGAAGDAQDAVRASFQVTETAQIAQVRRTVTPDALGTLHPAAYPLTLTFYDGTDTLYYDLAARLAYAGYNRTDAKAAAYAALMAEEACFGSSRPWYAPGNSADAIRRELSENYWGFLPLLRYGEGDPVLTAEILYCAPGVLSSSSRENLVSQYELLLSDRNTSAEKTAAALLALACLDRPVLDLLWGAAEASADMTVQERLYLAAAFAAIGDTAGARGLWEPLREAMGETQPGDAFCIVGADTEETIHLTALALLPASVIDADTACAMVRYLNGHTSSVDLHVLELAAFLTHYSPSAAEQTSFTYTTRTGETKDVTLTRGQSCTLTLTKSDFDALQIDAFDDGIVVCASYGASPEEAMLTPDEVLHISRSITPYDAQNGIYRVTLSYSGETDADHIRYALSDTIPAGARFFILDRNTAWTDASYAYLSNDGGQQMKGTISVHNPPLFDKTPLDRTQSYASSGTVSYYIRAAVRGTFTFEPALALNYEWGTYARTEAQGITIDDGGWTVEER